VTFSASDAPGSGRTGRRRRYFACCHETRAAFHLAYSGTLERFPNITWVLAHAGGTVPYLVDRFSLLWMVDHQLAARAPQGAAAYMANVYYDTALSANPHALSSLAELVD
jgi:6-methylsalicylate decarboxylase